MTFNTSNKKDRDTSYKYKFIPSLTNQKDNNNLYYYDSNEEHEREEINHDISNEDRAKSKDIFSLNYLTINSKKNKDNSFINEEIIEIHSVSEDSIQVIDLTSKKRMRSESSEIEYKMTYKIYDVKPTKKLK